MGGERRRDPPPPLARARQRGELRRPPPQLLGGADGRRQHRQDGKNLLKEGDIHTLLRLPTGIFYAQGVKANVLFFDCKPGAKEPWTKTVWVYDHRTNKHFTPKAKRMNRADLDEFVDCYRPGDRHNRKATWSDEAPEGRWRPYNLRRDPQPR